MKARSFTAFSKREHPLPGLALAVFVIASALFAYRGWAARNQMMYLDEIFVGEALQPELVFFRGFTTTWGETIFLQPFSGYLHTLVRAIIELVLLGPLTHYPIWSFSIATVVWAGCATLLYFAVRDVTSQAGGLLAAFALPLLHASNIILLGQLNALQWPMLVAAIIAVSTDFRPRSRLGSLLYAIFLVALSLNAALAFIPIAMLGWRTLLLPKRKQWRDGVHLILMAVPYTFQLLSYFGQRIRVVDGRNPWWYMWREIGYIPKLLLPARLRGSVTDTMGTGSLIVLGLFLAVLIGSVILSAIVSVRTSKRITRLLVELMVLAVSTAILSVYLNGNLNHQYVLIPTMTAWVAVIVALHVLRQHQFWKPIGQALSMIAFGIFVFSSIGLWKNGYEDPFFGPTGGTRLDVAIDYTQEWCINKSADDVINLTGHSISLPCEVIRQLR